VSADLKPGARPETAIALTLNGKPVSVSVGDDDTLLHRLRDLPFSRERITATLLAGTGA
jgi:hypothetical protein